MQAERYDKRLQNVLSDFICRKETKGSTKKCFIVISFLYHSYRSTVRGQNYSSDALFTPKMDIFKQRILNTAYIKTLEIFPSARE